MEPAHAAPVSAGSHHESGELAHVMSPASLLSVWAILMLLTAVTLLAAEYHLGQIDVIVALGIATVKAALVLLYFMHLRYDKPFNGLVFVASLLFLAVFIGIALMDTREYQPQIQSKPAQEASGH
jgi:cytochrome c oxidase subunit 4